MPKKVVIDCDPGIDDAVAIALAHGSPALEVLGLTTVAGNVGLDRTTDNALRLTEYFGMREVPVVPGAAVPLVRPPRLARDVHGESGLGNARLPEAMGEPARTHAVDFLIDTFGSAPGEISLVAIGPLTNIALAVRREPRLVDWVREFVVMGGSYTRGNTTPAAEFNMFADPEGAAVALGAGWRPVLIGLDLTFQTQVTPEAYAQYFGGLGRLESELLTPSLEFYGQHAQYADAGPVLHDACAVAHAIDPNLISTIPARVEVERQGQHTSGMTVVDFRPAEPADTEVATSLDRDAFWELLTAALRTVHETMPG